MSKGKQKQRDRKLNEAKRWAKRPVRTPRFRDDVLLQQSMIESALIAAAMGSVMTGRKR